MEINIDNHIIHDQILKTSQVAVNTRSMKNVVVFTFLLKYYYIVLSLSKILQISERIT